ncbi:helix-turn-helix domain-containing protein [Paraburkholderia phytofirmans]
MPTTGMPALPCHDRLPGGSAQFQIVNEINIDVIHKALANPVRRNILGWLRAPQAYFQDQEFPLDFGVCAKSIDRRCGLAQSTVSEHLKTLLQAELVTSRRISQCVFFKRNESVIQAFLKHARAKL